MNPTFCLREIKLRKLNIKDTTQEFDQYIPEDITDKDLLINYYNNNRFKYSQTCTINIIKHLPINQEDQKIVEVIATDHSSYLDEAYYDLESDGRFYISHLILPTKEWLESFLSEGNSLNLEIYVTDGNSIYLYSNGEYISQNPEDMITKSDEGTTISKHNQYYFSICHLYRCYIEHCKKLFDGSVARCSDKSKVDTFNRDFLWMTINVLKYYIEFGQLAEAQRILEEVNYCGTFCNDIYNNPQTTSGCGCNK